MAREYRIALRITNGLEIWFVSPRDIYIKDQYGWHNFTRWDMRQRNFCTRNWKPFRSILRDQRYLDMRLIRQWADFYDISVRHGSLPDWAKNNPNIRLIPEKGRARNSEKKYEPKYY